MICIFAGWRIPTVIRSSLLHRAFGHQGDDRVPSCPSSLPRTRQAAPPSPSHYTGAAARLLHWNGAGGAGLNNDTCVRRPTHRLHTALGDVSPPRVERDGDRRSEAEPGPASRKGNAPLYTQLQSLSTIGAERPLWCGACTE